MKIRTDFVSNSSSSSFIVINKTNQTVDTVSDRFIQQIIDYRNKSRFENSRNIKYKNLDNSYDEFISNEKDMDDDYLSEENINKQKNKLIFLLSAKYRVFDYDAYPNTMEITKDYLEHYINKFFDAIKYNEDTIKFIYSNRINDSEINEMYNGIVFRCDLKSDDSISIEKKKDCIKQYIYKYYIDNLNRKILFRKKLLDLLNAGQKIYYITIWHDGECHNEFDFLTSKLIAPEDYSDSDIQIKEFDSFIDSILKD